MPKSAKPKPAKKRVLPDERPLVPPNIVDPVLEAEEMVLEHGVEMMGYEPDTEVVRPHINYGDLVGLVSVGVPNQNTVVNVPTTTAGINAKKYLPIIALYNMVEFYVIEAYKQMRAGQRVSLDKLQDLIKAQKEVTALLNDAAGFMEHSKRNPSPAAAMGVVFNGVVNISNSILGKVDQTVELSEVLQELDKLTAKVEEETPKDAKKAQKDELTEDPFFRERYPDEVDSVGRIKK